MVTKSLHLARFMFHKLVRALSCVQSQFSLWKLPAICYVKAQWSNGIQNTAESGVCRSQSSDFILVDGLAACACWRMRDPLCPSVVLLNGDQVKKFYIVAAKNESKKVFVKSVELRIRSVSLMFDHTAYVDRMI